MTACRRSSPVSMYRLVNVSVNPAGRFGAPETEPGPSGVDSGAEDELMRYCQELWIGFRSRGDLLLASFYQLSISELSSGPHQRHQMSAV